VDCLGVTVDTQVASVTAICLTNTLTLFSIHLRGQELVSCLLSPESADAVVRERGSDLVYVCSGSSPELKVHASCPHPDQMAGDACGDCRGAVECQRPRAVRVRRRLRVPTGGSKSGTCRVVGAATVTTMDPLTPVQVLVKEKLWVDGLVGLRQVEKRTEARVRRDELVKHLAFLAMPSPCVLKR